MTKKNRIAALAVTGVVASLVVGSLVIASNMGFKINLQLAPSGQVQWISVPYGGPYTNADDLLNLVLGGNGVSHPAHGSRSSVLFRHMPRSQSGEMGYFILTKAIYQRNHKVV